MAPSLMKTTEPPRINHDSDFNSSPALHSTAVICHIHSCLLSSGTPVICHILKPLLHHAPLASWIHTPNSKCFSNSLFPSIQIQRPIISIFLASVLKSLLLGGSTNPVSSLQPNPSTVFLRRKPAQPHCWAFLPMQRL